MGEWEVRNIISLSVCQSHLVRGDGGAHRVRGRGGGAADAGARVLVVGVVVPEERFGVHTHSAPDNKRVLITLLHPSSRSLLPGPVRQGRVVGGVGGGHVVPVGRDG